MALVALCAIGFARRANEGTRKPEGPTEPPPQETANDKRSPDKTAEPPRATEGKDRAELAKARVAQMLAQKPVHPHLVLSKDDLPGIRERVKAGLPKEAWERIRKETEADLGDDLEAVVGQAKEKKTVLGRFLAELKARKDRAELAQARLAKKIPPPLNKGCGGEAMTALYQTAFAWLVSGEEQYAGNFRRIAKAMHEAFPQGIATDDCPIQLALAYDLGYELLTDEQRQAFRTGFLPAKPDELKKGAEWDRDFNGAGVYGNLAHPGHFWVLLQLLAVVGEPGFPQDRAELAQDAAAAAIRSAQEFLDVFFGADGDYPEHLNYLHYGVQCDLGPLALCALQRKGINVLGKGSSYERFLTWVPYELMPGTNVGLGMGDAGLAPTTDPDLYKLLLWANPENPYANWLADRIGGGVGIPVGAILWYRKPQEVDIAPLMSPVKHGRYMGTVYFRAGWGLGEPALTFDVRSFVGIHEQGDIGNFTLHA
ncbi:MAG: hypothetical protein NTW87_02570 [Planctomycetota bacterium]|nr:hypothetical protein [Planctomycetota bacterium]